MLVGLILAIVYIGYFIYEAYERKKRDRIINKYEKAHPNKEEIYIEPKRNETELTEAQIIYKEYLSSPHWQHMRQMALERSGHRCQLCGYRGNLKVHHNTYQNRGHEELTDLVVLCGKCHSKFHNK